MRAQTLLFRTLMSLVVCLPGILNNLHAQITPAWTRQISPVHWQELSRGVVLPRAKGTRPFMDLSRQLAAIERVKTTDQNWIRHKVFYSGVFSKQEKDILLAPAYPQATLGKTVYLHNKHTAFYNQLTAQAATAQISQPAFEKHQQVLQSLTGTLQQYYAQQHPTLFASAVFSKEEIQRLQTLPAQPAAYVLTPQELEDFASLPSQHAQQYWTERHLNTARWEAETLLLKPTEEMSPAEFAVYYRAHMRLSYFQLLAQVLERATDKRSSAIMRYKLPLAEGDVKLTDAQRGGKLLLIDGENSERYQEFEKNYGPYAAAEALEAPYEIALQYGAYSPELMGMREGERLRKLAPEACLAEVTPKITALEQQLTQLRSQTTQDPAFYKTHYNVYTKLQIYKTLAARAQFMLHFVQ